MLAAIDVGNHFGQPAATGTLTEKDLFGKIKSFGQFVELSATDAHKMDLFGHANDAVPRRALIDVWLHVFPPAASEAGGNGRCARPLPDERLERSQLHLALIAIGETQFRQLRV